MRQSLDDDSDSTDKLDAWKDQLRAQLELWLDSIHEIPEPENTAELYSEQEEPDLYSFYGELTALRTENRKSNRKTAEVFAQFGETLTRFQTDFTRLRDDLRPTDASDGLPRSHCLTLVELLDRGTRLASALNQPPQSPWPKMLDQVFTKKWATSWENVRQAVFILNSHLERTVRTAGLERIQTRDLPFDPATMLAVAAEPSAHSPNSVLEEIQSGYLWQNTVLRPAEVKISKPIA